jgi:hypothetical protein
MGMHVRTDHMKILVAGHAQGKKEVLVLLVS